MKFDESLPIHPTGFRMISHHEKLKNDLHLRDLQLAPDRHLYSPPLPGRIGSFTGQPMVWDGLMGEVNTVVLPRKHCVPFFWGGAGRGGILAV